MLLVTVLFTANSGEPAAGLTLTDIEITLLSRNRSTGAVATVWNAVNPTEEVGGGQYTRAYTDDDTEVYSYHAWAQYTGIATLDVNYSLQSAGGGTSVAEIADAVWDEALSGHTTSGTAGAYVRRIGSAAITVTSPVSTDGDITIDQGYDYQSADGRALEWTDDDGSWPDLTDATATFIIEGELEVTGTISNPTGPATITVELTAAQTAALTASSTSVDYVIECTTAGSHVILIILGEATIRRRRTAS
jgi:hypothetical protein